MRRAPMIAAFCVITVVMLAVTVMSAVADGPCEGPACTDDGDVILTPSVSGTPGQTGEPAGGGGGGGGPRVCSYQGEEIPCTSTNGVWSTEHGCYLQLDPNGGPPPPGSSPDGAWYLCQAPDACADLTCTRGTMWIDDPPPALPSPGELAQRALERMDLEPIDIGIVPEPGDDSIGLVGMPVWMWVDNPTANTFGPITESATAGPLTVTATARVTSTHWTMGDGTTITCTTRGTPYDDKYGDRESPDCGHRYTTTSWRQPGHRFEVVATTIWAVEWSGGGQSGSIPIEHTAATAVRVGELQVLNQ